MLLRTEGIEKRFGGLVAVDNVSIEVNEGEIYGIIGPNGAGKTTFLNCISGFYKPEKGRVFFHDKDVTGEPTYKLCTLGMARTFQTVRCFPQMTALENVKTAAIYGKGKHFVDAERHALELLHFVDFPVAEDSIAESLNTMQLKRLELARALATDCQLLLLDEVAAGLTPAELPAFIELIKKIRDSGVSIICIEHLMKFIMGVCDNIAVLQFGKMIAAGSARDVMNDPKVIAAYLGETAIS